MKWQDRERKQSYRSICYWKCVLFGTFVIGKGNISTFVIYKYHTSKKCLKIDQMTYIDLHVKSFNEGKHCPNLAYRQKRPTQSQLLLTLLLPTAIPTKNNLPNPTPTTVRNNTSHALPKVYFCQNRQPIFKGAKRCYKNEKLVQI